MIWNLIIMIPIFGVLLGNRYQFFALLASSLLLMLLTLFTAINSGWSSGHSLLIGFALLAELQFFYIVGLFFASVWPRIKKWLKNTHTCLAF